MKLLKNFNDNLTVLNLLRSFKDGKLKLPLNDYENIAGITRESFKILEKEGYVNILTGEFDEESGGEPEPMIYCFLTSEGMDLYRELRLRKWGVFKQLIYNIKKAGSYLLLYRYLLRN